MKSEEIKAVVWKWNTR